MLPWSLFIGRICSENSVTNSLMDVCCSLSRKQVGSCHF